MRKDRYDRERRGCRLVAPIAHPLGPSQRTTFDVCQSSANTRGERCNKPNTKLAPKLSASVGAVALVGSGSSARTPKLAALSPPDDGIRPTISWRPLPGYEPKEALLGSLAIGHQNAGKC